MTLALSQQTQRALEVASTASRWVRYPDGTFEIPSQSRPGVWRETTPQSCSCPAREHHPDRPCCHMTAASIVTVLLEQQPQPLRLVPPRVDADEVTWDRQWCGHCLGNHADDVGPAAAGIVVTTNEGGSAVTHQFNPSEWATVLPRKVNGMFASPYLEPADIVAQETGSDLKECIGCGQMREHVTTIVYDDATFDVCADCLIESEEGNHE